MSSMRLVEPSAAAVADAVTTAPAASTTASLDSLPPARRIRLDGGGESQSRISPMRELDLHIDSPATRREEPFSFEMRDKCLEHVEKIRAWDQKQNGLGSLVCKLVHITSITGSNIKYNCLLCGEKKSAGIQKMILHIGGNCNAPKASARERAALFCYQVRLRNHMEQHPKGWQKTGSQPLPTRHSPNAAAAAAERPLLTPHAAFGKDEDKVISEEELLQLLRGTTTLGGLCMTQGLSLLLARLGKVFDKHFDISARVKKVGDFFRLKSTAVHALKNFTDLTLIGPSATRFGYILLCYERFLLLHQHMRDALEYKYVSAEGGQPDADFNEVHAILNDTTLLSAVRTVVVLFRKIFVAMRLFDTSIPLGGFVLPVFVLLQEDTLSTMRKTRYPVSITAEVREAFEFVMTKRVTTLDRLCYATMPTLRDLRAHCPVHQSEFQDAVFTFAHKLVMMEVLAADTDVHVWTASVLREINEFQHHQLPRYVDIQARITHSADFFATALSKEYPHLALLCSHIHARSTVSCSLERHSMTNHGNAESSAQMKLTMETLEQMYLLLDSIKPGGQPNSDLEADLLAWAATLFACPNHEEEVEISEHNEEESNES